jgi:feruloyl esterase
LDKAANDIISALETWVENDQAPKSIIATKFEHDDPKGKVMRTMPLCPFPAMARYAGKGDVNDAANWSCATTDKRLLEKGPAGQKAEVYAEIN